MPNFPVYKCQIDDSLESELQVEFIAMVDKPAIEKHFLAFNEAKISFAIDDERRIVSGPAMIADMLIYRNDVGGLGEYYTVFDKQTILSIVQKFFKKGFIKNFNMMHNPDEKTKDITIYESFITDSARGIMPMKGFEDVGEGSWFITAKVDDDAAWEDVKAGKIKAFSVEGIFKQIPVIQPKMSAEQALEKIQLLISMIE